jgi:hypothetical protein
MISIKNLLLSALFYSFCATPSVFAAQDSTITFKNQRGSTMILTWNDKEANSGTLTGTFNTAVGSCKADVGVPLPLVGYFNGNALTMTVNFPNCKKVAAMTANISQNKDKMHALWLVGNHSSDPQGKDWDSNIVGMDTYQRVK